MTSSMFKKLRRLTCRHAFMWSERRQMDVCYQCGQARVADPPETVTPPPPTGLDQS